MAGCCRAARYARRRDGPDAGTNKSPADLPLILKGLIGTLGAFRHALTGDQKP
jgi:hypothetical protein